MQRPAGEGRTRRALRIAGVAMVPWALGSGVALAEPAAVPPARTPASAGPAQAQDGLTRFTFDIAAQPLDDALHQYAGITGRPAVFRSSLVAGRTASAVQGTYAAEAGLRQLLQGTGLTADRVQAGDVHAFVLRRVDAGEAAVTGTADAPPPAVAAAGRTDYDARVQQAIWQTLCANPLTAPGDYRALLRFRVDPVGKLGHAQLLTSTGQARRDAALLQLMQRVQVGAPPPAELAQPLTLLLLPRGAVAGRACPPGATP